MKRNHLFLYNLFQESKASARSRISLASDYQLNTILRVLNKVALGEIPITNECFPALKKTRKLFLIKQVDSAQNLLEKLRSSKEVKIAYL